MEKIKYSDLPLSAKIGIAGGMIVVGYIIVIILIAILAVIVDSNPFGYINLL